MRPLHIAHRGYSGRYPENTLLAFQKAVEAGADWLELDVVSTFDDVLIVSHDTMADRCTNGAGLFCDMSLAEVKALDAGAWFDPQFADERIPMLQAVLDWVVDQPVRVCIEVKGVTPLDYHDTARALVALLQERDYLQPVVISSFDPDCLEAIKAWEPLLATALDPTPQDGSATPWQLCAQVLRCKANFMLHRHTTLSAELVDEARQHGFDVWTWTIDDPVAMRRAADLGAAGIMTNYPELVPA